MKPRIKKEDDLWICFSDNRIGKAITIKSAFEAWLKCPYGLENLILE